MPSSDPGTDSDHQRARILWVEEEHAIMAEKLGTFRAKDRTKEERRKIVQKVCKAIKLFNSTLTDAEWVLKKKAVKAWMCNNGRQLKDKDLFTLANSWSTRRVVGFLEKKRVVQKAEEASGHKAGHPDFFGYYQVSLTKVIDDLAPDQLKHYEQLAAKWNLVGCPPDAQQNNWKSSGRRFFQSISKTAWQQYGMRVIIFANVKSTDGIRVLSIHDENNRYGAAEVRSMQKEMPSGWAKMAEEWSQYSQYTAGFDDDKEHTVSSKVMAARKQRLALDFDDDGMPILPAVSSTSGANKEIIRSYMTEHYRLASNKKTAVVPWTEVIKNPAGFMDQRLFPDGLKMMDPSKLTNQDAKAFLLLWQKVPFEFKAFQDKDGMHPAIYKNRAKPVPKLKKRTRFVDDIDQQPSMIRRGSKSTRQTESDGYDSDEESDSESDSITHNPGPDNHPVKKFSVIPPNQSSSDEGPARPAPKPKPSQKTQVSKRFNDNPDRAGMAGPVLELATTAPAAAGPSAKHMAPTANNPGAVFYPASTEPALPKESDLTTEFNNRPVENLTSIIAPNESSSSDEGPATPTPKPKTTHCRSKSFVGPGGQTRPTENAKATGPGLNFIPGETPIEVGAAGPARKAVKGRRGKVALNDNTPADTRVPSTEMFASISNPNPITPRATRSMTGATPAKTRPEVLLTRRAAVAIAAPERPKPKPTGKGKGKSKEVEDELEVNMRRTSKRTLAMAQQSSPVKRRRT